MDTSEWDRVIFQLANNIRLFKILKQRNDNHLTQCQQRLEQVQNNDVTLKKSLRYYENIENTITLLLTKIRAKKEKEQTDQIKIQNRQSRITAHAQGDLLKALSEGKLKTNQEVELKKQEQNKCISNISKLSLNISSLSRSSESPLASRITISNSPGPLTPPKHHQSFQQAMTVTPSPSSCSGCSTILVADESHPNNIDKEINLTNDWSTVQIQLTHNIQIFQILKRRNENRMRMYEEKLQTLCKNQYILLTSFRYYESIVTSIDLLLKGNGNCRSVQHQNMKNNTNITKSPLNNIQVITEVHKNKDQSKLSGTSKVWEIVHLQLRNNIQMFQFLTKWNRNQILGCEGALNKHQQQNDQLLRSLHYYKQVQNAIHLLLEQQNEK